jgi:hypothetical protein
MPGPYCTAADVKAIAREFATVDDELFAPYIARASRELNPKVWGQRVVDGCALLTAHLMSMSPPAGVVVPPSTGAPITSKTVGNVSVTYGVSLVPQQSVGYSFSQSRHGVEFVRIRALVSAGPFLAR